MLPVCDHTPDGLKSDLTIFSRYNIYPENPLEQEFCTFEHHRLHVAIFAVIIFLQMAKAILKELQGKPPFWVSLSMGDWVLGTQRICSNFFVCR